MSQCYLIRGVQIIASLYFGKYYLKGYFGQDSESLQNFWSRIEYIDVHLSIVCCYFFHIFFPYTQQGFRPNKD